MRKVLVFVIVGLMLCMMACQYNRPNEKPNEMEDYESRVDSLAIRVILLCYEHRAESCDTALIDSIGDLALEIFDAGNGPTDFLEK